MAVDLSVEGGLAFVRIDNPPVNGLGLAVRRGLLAAFDEVLPATVTLSASGLSRRPLQARQGISTRNSSSCARIASLVDS